MTILFDETYESFIIMIFHGQFHSFRSFSIFFHPKPASWRALYPLLVESDMQSSEWKRINRGTVTSCTDWFFSFYPPRCGNMIHVLLNTVWCLRTMSSMESLSEKLELIRYSSPWPGFTCGSIELNFIIFSVV